MATLRHLCVSAVAGALALILCSAHAAEKKSAKVECTPSEEKLVYDCMVMLSGKKSGDMIANAEFTVGADMPSMPMAHNVEPVAAHNAGNGMYHVRITLEMYGEWALKLEFTKPGRDLVISKLVFAKDSVSPAGGESCGHNHKKHDHKKHDHKEKKD